jgi:dipeptidyl aminopeptidase/acylaminoacyl peptidase
VCFAAGVLGCKGATLPATNISSTGAKLSLHGEADNGTAFSYFEYWQTAVPSLKSNTTVRNWPAGAVSDFGESVRGLRQGTSYSFRACGNDSGKPAACVNSRSFTTGVSGYSGIAHPCGNVGSICVGAAAGFGSPSHDPSWSPDATKIAYENSGKLRIWNVASGTSTQLGSENIGGHPDWSPDGTKIAVDNGIIRASDGARLSGVEKRNPSWSPDGTKIAYECDPPGDPVYDEICVDGHPLTNTYLEDEDEPAWSPDGTKIAYTNRGAGTHGCTLCAVVFVMNADGTNQRQLTFNPAFGSSPSWSPSGTQIAYQGVGTDRWAIRVVNAAGGTSSVLFEGVQPDWSPRP